MALCKVTTLLMHDDTSADCEAAAIRVNAGVKVRDTGALDSQEWRLCTSLSEATYSEDESGNTSIGNDERDAVSDMGDGDDENGEQTGEASGDSEDEKAASEDVSAKAGETEAEAAGATSCHGRLKQKKVPNPHTFWIEPSFITHEQIKELVDASLISGYRLLVGEE